MEPLTVLKIFALVIGVQSGDTIVVSVDGQERTIALAGIAAPQAGQPYFEQARDSLAGKVKDKKVFVQVFGKNTEGLETAAVWLDKRSINAEMVAEGHAWYDPRHPEYATIAAAQEKAKAKKLGLWAGEKPTPPWEFSQKDATPRPNGVNPTLAPSPVTGDHRSQATGLTANSPELGEARELALDDGKPVGKKSFPQGHAVMFTTPAGEWYLTSVRIHGARYGLPQPPDEDFYVTLCDKNYLPIKSIAFPYAKFKRSENSEWVTLNVPPIKLPEKFVICLNFNAERTKGVYVSHDAEGTGLMGLPDKPGGYFSGGDWLIRATIKASGSVPPVAAAPLVPTDKAGEETPAPAQTKVPKLGEAKELALDDGKPAGKKSFPQGHAAKFESPDGDWWLTSVRVHGARYGLPQPPKEDFHLTLCDPQFKTIKDFAFSYAKFKRSADCKWVTLNVPPTKAPKEFVICLNFNPERTKGVFVSHDAEGTALVGLPDKPMGQFNGGDWLIRPTIKPSGPVPVASPTAPVPATPPTAPVSPKVPDASAAPAKGTDRQVKVTVDPRVELFSIIFRLAGNPEYSQGRVESYVKDVESHFGPFRNHPAVQMAKKLRSTTGVSFDAPMSLAVHLTDTENLTTKAPLNPWPESVDRRWNEQSVKEFLASVRQFITDTSFNDFFREHRPLYQIAESRMREALEKEGHLEWFDEFFGARPAASFTVVLGMINGGSCYGPHSRAADGKEELYCVLGVWKTDAEGKPQFDPTGVIPTVVHEFCHSYTNDFVLRHQTELREAGEKLFAPVASSMKSQAYGNGQTVLFESLVRACEVRYTRKYAGDSAAEKDIQEQNARRFVCVEPLSSALEEYEAHRDKYPTLEAFSPRLISVFNECADKFTKEQDSRPKIVSVVPADGDQKVDPDLKAITVVFDRPMKAGSWALVGGGPNFPETQGDCSYDEKCITWTVPIKLKPDWEYRFMLNAAPKFMAFQSREGVPLEPSGVSFKTAKK